MDEATIKAFWQQHPCDDTVAGRMNNKNNEAHENFFRQYDARRYSEQSHIPECLDNIDFDGKKVLEIGLGQGADSEQIIKRGAKWSGLDLTQEAITRVQTRLAIRRLSYEELKLGSALEIPYNDNSFDIVFSHGVLHHIPDIVTAQKEIFRVLKPEGRLIAVLYAKWSVNYLLSINIIRRLRVLIMYALGIKPKGIFEQHLKNAHDSGLWNYLRMENFIHKNTDGPLNPYSKVYSAAEARKFFINFKLSKSYKRNMVMPLIKNGKLPFGSLLGWYLWLHFTPEKQP